MFDWDPAKARSNQLKHGVPFAEAASCFEDLAALEVRDVTHSVVELRWIRIGETASGRIVYVVFTRRGLGEKEVIRIISARQASSRERAARTRQRDRFF